MKYDVIRIDTFGKLVVDGKSAPGQLIKIVIDNYDFGASIKATFEYDAREFYNYYEPIQIEVNE